jgi:Tfp pilus assembly protein PilV
MSKMSQRLKKINACVRKNSKGMALVEVIAALGIAVVVITSLVSLSLFTLRSSLSSKLQLQGTKVATRESELIRSYRDSDAQTWATFVAGVRNCYGGANCCMNSGGTAVLLNQATSCVDGTGLEVVTRSFTATKVDGSSQVGLTDNTVRFDIKATWTVGGAEKTTHLYTDLTNWRRAE